MQVSPSCYSAPCLSSYCKEELLLALLTLPTAAAGLALQLPLLEAGLVWLQLPPPALQPWLSPGVARAADLAACSALPLLVLALLPAYTKAPADHIAHTTLHSDTPRPVGWLA